MNSQQPEPKSALLTGRQNGGHLELPQGPGTEGGRSALVAVIHSPLSPTHLGPTPRGLPIPWQPLARARRGGAGGAAPSMSSDAASRYRPSFPSLGTIIEIVRSRVLARRITARADTADDGKWKVISHSPSIAGSASRHWMPRSAPRSRSAYPPRRWRRSGPSPGPPAAPEPGNGPDARWGASAGSQALVASRWASSPPFAGKRSRSIESEAMSQIGSAGQRQRIRQTGSTRVVDPDTSA